MKTLPLALLALTIGSSQAVEITYSQSGGPSQSGSMSGFLPLFDTGSPEIPDNAVLQSARVDIDVSAGALFVLWARETGGPESFSGWADITVVFHSPNFHSLAPLFGQVVSSFSSRLLQPGVAFDVGLGLFQSLSGTVYGAGLEYFTPAGPHSSFDLYGQASAGLYLDGPSPPFLVNNIMQTAATYNVTYTYAVPEPSPSRVPDGGSTALMLGLGLLSLRRLKVSVPA